MPMYLHSNELIKYVLIVVSTVRKLKSEGSIRLRWSLSSLKFAALIKLLLQILKHKKIY